MNILLPLDGSQESLAALAWARLIAKPSEDRLELFRSYWPIAELHVAAGFSATFPELSDIEEPDAEIVQEMKEQSEGLQGLQLDFACKAGSPVRAILERAEGKDLIVLASRGHSGLKKLLLGSVATQLVRASETPLMVVNASKESNIQPSVKKIMVPLDGSPRAEGALKLASALARRLDATIVLYQAVIRQWRTSQGSAPYLQAAKDYLDGAAEKIEGDIETETLVSSSVDSHKIIEQAEVAQADLLVMTSHGRSGVSRWVLGSVTENVIQRANCPVVVVYDRPEDALCRE